MSIAEKLVTIAENVPLVYEAGYDKGMNDGKQSEYDMFWDAFQQNGARTNYLNAFNNIYWTDVTYKPKHPIVCKGRCLYAFYGSAMTDILQPVDITEATDTGYMFGYCSILKTIPKIIVNKTTNFNAWFDSCLSLENVTFEGVIANNGLNLQWSTKLSHDSITNIIGVLSTTTSGLSITLSKTAVNNAFETSQGLADGSTSAEWLALVGTKTNWNISLV